MRRRSAGFLGLFRIAWPLLIAIVLTGCTTKSKARERARAAFIAGQRQALARIQQTREPSITVVGHVRNPVIPWTEDSTVARTIVSAGYYGLVDPSMILIVRNGQEIRIEPTQLLSGEDIPLQAGDIVEIRE